jgi:hypothetical protein
VTQTPPAAAQPALAPESFLAVVFRRTRYSIAIILSAYFFCTLGWQLAAPPPEWAGVSLVVWHNHGILSTLLLTGMLLAATAVCSLLVHPDSPHMGLACALLGMAGLSIRGGTVQMLMVHTRESGSMPHVADALALECVEWGCVILLADAFARLFHDRLLANQQWVLRANPILGTKISKTDLGVAAGFSKTVSHALRTDRIKGPVRIPLAMAWSGAIAFLFLYVFMQSQLKGQVLMACFVAFIISTICAYAAFPTVPFWSLILAVPLTGAVAFLVGRNAVPGYPGHAPFFAMRALPIDYLTAGVPGAILGLYYGLSWSLGSLEDL